MPDETQSPEEITILVDFPDQTGLVQASLGSNVAEWLEKSNEALDRAMATIVGMAQRTAELRDSIPDEFTQAEIEFGVKLTIEAGALLARTGGEGSINVKLTWEREKPTTNPNP